MTRPGGAPLPGRRRPWLTMGVTALLFLGGASAGLALAAWRAPASPLATFCAFMAFPLAYVAALSAWQGAALTALLASWFLRRRRPANPDVTLRRSAAIMIPIPPLFTIPAGLVAGLAAGSWITTTFLFAAAGLAYGLALYAAARRDLLAIFE